MKHPRTFRLALAHGFFGATLLASSALALSPAEIDALRLRADRGNPVAQYNLGLAYADPDDEIHNPALAYAWLSLAASNGAEGKALAELTARLTPAQIAEGKRRLSALSANPVAAVSDASPIVGIDESAPAPAESPVASAPAAAPADTSVELEQRKLSAELAAAWKENELLKSRLSAQLADANKRLAIAEAALASKDKEIAALNARVEELANKEFAVEFRAPSTDVAAQVETLRKDLAKAVDETAQARRAQTLAESEAANLKAAADRASAERLTLTAQLDAANSALAAAQVAVASPANDALKAERDRLAETVKTLEQERDALTARLAESPAAPAGVGIADAPPTPEADPAAAARFADLEKAKAETDTKLEAALRTFTLQQAEIERLQKTIASIDDERGSLASELEAAKERMSNQDAALAEANANLADARRMIDTATAELIATRDQLRQTQAQAAASATEVHQLKTRLALAAGAPSAPSRPGSTPAAVSLPPPPAPLPPPPARVETPAAPRFHTVAAGDSLSRISKQYYGTANRWKDILDANRDVISNPDALSLGTRLRIP